MTELVCEANKCHNWWEYTCKYCLKNYCSTHLAIGDHNCKSVKEVCDTFKKVGMIKCPSCGKQFKKIDKYTYKPACKCFKNSKLLLSVG